MIQKKILIEKTKNPLKKNKTLNFKFDDFSESDTYTINLLATFSGIKKWLLKEGENFNFETELTEENIKKDIDNIPFKEIKLYFNNNFSLLDFNAFKKAMYLMEKSDPDDYYISNSKSRFVYNPFYILTDLFYCEDFYCDSYSSYYFAARYNGSNINYYSEDIIKNECMKKKFFNRASDYYKAISKNDFFENLFFVIAYIESFMLPNKIINIDSYNEIMEKLKKLKNYLLIFIKQILISLKVG